MRYGVRGPSGRIWLAEDDHPDSLAAILELADLSSWQLVCEDGRPGRWRDVSARERVSDPHLSAR